MLEYNMNHPLSYSDIFSIVSENYVHQYPVCKKHNELVSVMRQNRADNFIKHVRDIYSHIVYLEKINENTKHIFSNSYTVENMNVDHIWVMKVIRYKQSRFRENVCVLGTTYSVIIADLGFILNVQCLPKLIDGSTIRNWKDKNLTKTKTQKWVIKDGKFVCE